ncbi:hypothetical protein [Maribacter sp. ACAM166]|uniref:hypothetical protein n=1 Tax=Maribacter sp. ACAM166 TaxID=2508996 RepID=UPI0010FE0450|nr:hypothetical protein [Maribacter sp. ACAM166]TLP81838.1 hypothetical protein ES765_03930 [Maribacter sp. ACAM166]
MRQTKFTKIRLLLQGANELFDEGKITSDEFAELVSGVENDYNKIVREMDIVDTSEILLNYINQSK